MDITSKLCVANTPMFVHMNVIVHKNIYQYIKMYLSKMADNAPSFDHVTRNSRSRRHCRDCTGPYVLFYESFFSVLLYFRTLTHLIHEFL